MDGGRGERSIEAIDQLVDAYRVRCLWFLRPDFYPSTDTDRLRVLEYIERYGDRDGFRTTSCFTTLMKRRK